MSEPTPLQRWVRRLLVLTYLAAIVAGLTTQVAPRVFWTMLLPLLPLSIVVMGFYNWRRICPLAFFGEIGQRIPRSTQRRVPAWLERWFFVVIFATMAAMLALRLLATNGDGVWLAGLLAGLAVAAFATNRIFTGKTWCNFLCPVGLIERIYTEPRPLLRSSNSQCARCTACKKHCPDIDQENAYWRDLMSAGRSIATFAFPGLVLGFYVYFWLRHGDWEAYFDGRWTLAAAGAGLVVGPGFFFAPGIPALVAAPVTLVLFSAASYGTFTLAETTAARFVPDAARRRHFLLAVAAFVAFSTFYFFAGAPTLRRLPFGTRAMAFIAPVLAVLFLVKRWGRTQEAFIQGRGAASLLRNWPFEEPPPADPAEVYAWIKAGEHARERQVAAYANTVRGILSEGLVTASELRLLEQIRKQLGVTEREHERVFARLSDEERDLFAEDHVVSVEERAQLEGYETALSDALIRHAPAKEVESLRLAFAVSPPAHEAVLRRIQGERHLLLARAGNHLDRVRTLGRDLAILAGMNGSAATSFLLYLLQQVRDESVERVLEILEISGDRERVQALRPRLLGGDEAARKAALDQLVEACPGMEELTRQLGPLLVATPPLVDEEQPGQREELLERTATTADPYLRSGAVWVAGSSGERALQDLCRRALNDSHPLVRETAGRFSHAGGVVTAADAGFTSLATIERMQFLRGVPLFTDLDPEDLHDLALLAEEETYTAPRALCEEGDTEADALFVLISGTAAVLVRGTGIIERELAVLGPGEVVGEMSVLDGSPRSATVRPKDGPVSVLRIPGHRFRTRLLPRTRVALPLLVTLAQRIRAISRRLAGGDG